MAFGLHLSPFGKEKIIKVFKAKRPRNVAGFITDAQMLMRKAHISPGFVTIRPDLLRQVVTDVTADWNPDYTAHQVIDKADKAYTTIIEDKKFLGLILLLDEAHKDVQANEAKLSDIELTHALVVVYEPG